MRKLLILLLVLASAYAAVSQQIAQLSQFMIADYLINPAVAGSRDYFDVRSVNRYQWAGLQDAPRTYFLSLNGPLRFKNMGAGGYIFNDIAGPTRRTGFQLSATYALDLNANTKLAFALSGGLLRFGIDASRIEMIDQSDPALYNDLRARTVFDAKAAIMLSGSAWSVGLTAPQLLQNRMDLFETNNQLARLEDHFLLSANYRFDIGSDIALRPSLLVKYVHPAPIALDVAALAVWRETLHAGFSYRHRDALALILGYEFRQTISCSYAYDITTSNLRNYSSGTHEFVLGLKLKQ